ncbi:hypothetical protein [Streptomyces sp. URMC 124]|uniref:hypothetical protein n=1 Tax=Streptomyces sp. URMC 124 TaxID=3423405 RepID=UPI003F1D2F9F
MNDDHDDEPLCSGLPIYTATDGQAYMSCRDVAALLRAIAEACRSLDEADFAPAVLDEEANAIDCHAIIHTRT